MYLHNSGTGEFGFIDIGKQRFEPILFCPGYLRGLSFFDKFAVVGLSQPRTNKTFSGLALDDALETRKMAPRAGLYFVDLAEGTVAHSITFEGVVSELYEVAVLPGIRQPALLGPMSQEIRRAIKINHADVASI